MSAEGRAGEAVSIAAPKSYAKLRPAHGLTADAVADHQRYRIRRAMVELVAEHGYEAVRVGDVARRARVSTRTFYELSKGKQACLLDVHDSIMAAAAAQMSAGVVGTTRREGRLLVALRSLAALVAKNPAEARFACVDACAAGLGVVDRNRRAADCFAAILARWLPTGAGHRAPPPMLVDGIVAGLAHVVRSRLIAGREAELSGAVDDLHAWVVSLCAPEALELDGAALSSGTQTVEAVAAFDLCPRDAAGLEPLVRERRWILAATLGIAAKTGYWQLKASQIRAETGVSRARFKRHFDGPEEAFDAALGLLAGRVADFVAQESAAQGAGWPAGFHRAVTSLCRAAAEEPAAARLALVEVLAAGPGGLRHLSRLIDGTADRLLTGLPHGSRPPRIAAEASMGAVWGLVHRCVATRHADRLVALAPYLSYLSLAPAIGPTATLDAIHATAAPSKSDAAAAQSR